MPASQLSYGSGTFVNNTANATLGMVQASTTYNAATVAR